MPDIPLLHAGAFFAVYRLIYRMVCVGRIYGLAIALCVLLRVPLANWINSAASVLAMKRFFAAKWNHQPLVWVKTEHAYPSQAALAPQTMRLGELLVANGYISEAQLEHALRSKPGNARLGEHLVQCGCIDEESLYEGLSLQRCIPQCRVEPSHVKRAVARSLPAEVARRNKLVPFRVEAGHLVIAGPELPTPELRDELRRFTSLEIEFQLVTPSNYAELSSALLPA